MSIDSKIAIICITGNGKKLACKIKSLINTGDIYFIQNKKIENLSEKKSNTIVKSVEDNILIITVNRRLKNFVEDIFDKYSYIIFIMATGIVIRTIAPLVTSKFSDPAILVTDEKGTNIISLLSGHMGGANEMTLYISKLIGSNPVITTATDVNKKSSLDMIAKRLDGYIEDFRNNVKDINSMLVNNRPVGLYIDGNYYIDTRGFRLIDNSKSLNQHYTDNKAVLDELDKIVVISDKYKFIDNEVQSNLNLDLNKFVKLIPKDIVIGVGCRRNIDSQLLQDSLIEFLSNNNIDIKSIKEIGSIEIKKDEKAIVDLSKYLGVPFKTVSVQDISKIDHLFNKSQWVKKSVGVYSVSEPVAHILSGGNLIIEKHKYKGITFSVGRANI